MSASVLTPEVAAVVREYRKGAGHEDGFVVVFRGEVAGWVLTLEYPRSWEPGCLAVAEDGTEYRATGGNAQDGAERWEPARKVIAMSPAQKDRSAALYREAFIALNKLSEGRLNLDTETREALNRARGALEEFDSLRIQQPTSEEVG